MPHAFEKTKQRIPKQHDRRRKLTEAEKAAILENREGFSWATLAGLYAVSKRTIEFIFHPERLARHEARRKMKPQPYTDKGSRAAEMRRHRHYKRQLEAKGLLAEPDNPVSRG